MEKIQIFSTQIRLLKLRTVKWLTDVKSNFNIPHNINSGNSTDVDSHINRHMSEVLLRFWVFGQIQFFTRRLQQNCEKYPLLTFVTQVIILTNMRMVKNLRIVTNMKMVTNMRIARHSVANLSAVGCQLKYRDKAGGILVTGESAKESGDKGKIWPQ